MTDARSPILQGTLDLMVLKTHAGTEFMVRPALPDARGERIVAIWNHDIAMVRSRRAEARRHDGVAAGIDVRP